MKEGHIIQVGTPMEIYMRPADTFVSNFIGVSNFLECEAPPGGDIRIGDYHIRKELASDYIGKAQLSVRPEFLYVRTADKGTEGIEGMIQLATFLDTIIGSFDVICSKLPMIVTKNSAGG